MATCNVDLTEAQSAAIDRLVASGRYRNASEVLRAALRLLEREETEAAIRRDVTEDGDEEAIRRALSLARVKSRAIEVFGSKAEAEAWLNAPAIGLDRRRPIDLLGAAGGMETVEAHLTRIEYGVHT